MPELRVTIDSNGHFSITASASELEELQKAISALLPLRAQLFKLLSPGETPQPIETSRADPEGTPLPIVAPSREHFCPIHNMPFHQYKFGWAHPPLQPGGKWCKEELSK